MLPHASGSSRRQPARITELDVRKSAERGGNGGASSVPTTVLSLWQPLASFLAHGLQRVEGRGWSTQFRGPLWIHAGSKQVSPEDIAKWESVYRDAFALDGCEAQFPSHYPTSALVGLVEVVDVVSAEDFKAWRSLPKGVRHEGRCHGSGSLFLVQDHHRLHVPLKMSGQHKLWRLDQKVADQVYPHLVASVQGHPVDFVRHRELVRAEPTLARECDVDGSAEDQDSDEDVEEMEKLMLELAVARSLADAEEGAWPDPSEPDKPDGSICCAGEGALDTAFSGNAPDVRAHDRVEEEARGPQRRGRWGRNRGSRPSASAAPEP